MKKADILESIRWQINYWTGQSYLDWVRAKYRYKCSFEEYEIKHRQTLMLYWQILKDLRVEKDPLQGDHWDGHFEERKRLAEEVANQTL